MTTKTPAKPAEKRTCASCRRSIDPSWESIQGTKGDYHVTCWNQLGLKARKP